MTWRIKPFGTKLCSSDVRVGITNLRKSNKQLVSGRNVKLKSYQTQGEVILGAEPEHLGRRCMAGVDVNVVTVTRLDATATARQ